jgi:hypothetical protein
MAGSAIFFGLVLFYQVAHNCRPLSEKKDVFWFVWFAGKFGV